jgi:hypothetical protein
MHCGNGFDATVLTVGGYPAIPMPELLIGAPD